MKCSLQLVVNAFCETMVSVKHIICDNVLHWLTLYVLVALMIQIKTCGWESYLCSGGEGDVYEVGKSFFTVLFSG